MHDMPPPEQNTPRVSIELKERALAAAGEGITIVDARLPGMPLIYANPAFEKLTGYSREESIGYNCRFLQGPETDPKATETIRRAINSKHGCVVEILNYRKDGTTFWNRLSITPALNEANEVTHYIGIQSDVTARRRAEEKLAIANREMHRDLEAAASIQQSLLPTVAPKLTAMEVAWQYRPSKEIGGDTLNVLRLDARTVAFYLLDVSGHGVPASLLSFTLAHTLSNFPEQSCLFDAADGGWIPATPSKVAARLNQRFKLDPEAPQFFAMFYGLLDESTRTLRYVLAGHPPLVVARANGDVGFLFSNGPPVGLLEDAEFPEQDLSLNPGDRLFVYTDGLNEAMSPDGRELQFERIGEVASATRRQPLEAGVKALVALAEGWTGGEPQDDVSVLALSCVR
jgi:phosphoserine phosphatase RsbU/P